MSNKKLAEIQAMIDVHNKQARLLRGQEQKIKDRRIFHEKSAACLEGMIR